MTIKLSDTPGSIRRPAPLLGEHSEEILAELAALRASRLRPKRIERGTDDAAGQISRSELIVTREADGLAVVTLNRPGQAQCYQSRDVARAEGDLRRS